MMLMACSHVHAYCYGYPVPQSVTASCGLVSCFCSLAVQSLEDMSVTVRERDSMAQIRVPQAEVAGLIRKLVDGTVTWSEAAER